MKIIRLALLSALLGCSKSHLDGDRFELSTPWYATIITIGFGLALVVLGLLLVLGRLKPKGKPRALGVMALLAGGMLSVEHFDYIVSEYVDYYHECRPHQGIGNRLIGKSDEEEPPAITNLNQLRCEERLGGLLKHYYRAA